MRDAFEELFYWRTDQKSKRCIHGRDYEDLNRLINIKEDELLWSLPQQYRESYFKLIDKYYQIEEIIKRDYFIEGFQIGLRIGLEIADLESDKKKDR